MIVKVVDKSTVVLEEETDFSAFFVDAGNAPSEVVASAFATSGAGTVSDAGALVCRTFVRLLAGDAALDTIWLESLDAMIAFARQKGWLSPDEHYIKAHIENLGADDLWFSGHA